MSVVVIGDRAVGKSRMGLALAEPSEEPKVQVIEPDYQTLKDEYINVDTGGMTPTRDIYKRPFKIKVELSTKRIIESVWIDTPGEIYDLEWQIEHPHAWKEFKETLNQSLGIILLLHPYQEQVKPTLIDSTDSIFALDRETLLPAHKWKVDLVNWMKFLRENCNQVNYILICLNKADLFCSNLDTVGKNFQSYPSYKRQDEALKYFTAAQIEIEKYNRKDRPFQFFITCVKNRSLLELPWIYLSPYILYS